MRLRSLPGRSDILPTLFGSPDVRHPHNFQIGSAPYYFSSKDTIVPMLLLDQIAVMNRALDYGISVELPPKYHSVYAVIHSSNRIRPSAPQRS
ncbi:hypothetical protein D3C81_1867770 [compost metagenome]